MNAWSCTYVHEAQSHAGHSVLNPGPDKIRFWGCHEIGLNVILWCTGQRKERRNEHMWWTMCCYVYITYYYLTLIEILLLEWLFFYGQFISLIARNWQWFIKLFLSKQLLGQFVYNVMFILLTAVTPTDNLQHLEEKEESSSSNSH